MQTSAGVGASNGGAGGGEGGARSAPPLMVSVSGCRGIVGASLTPETVARFVGGFLHAIRVSAQDDEDGGRRLIVLGRDGRAGGEPIAYLAAGALAHAGYDVVDLGVAMTPTVGVMVEHLGAGGGLVITASHNPGEWNGLKPITPGGHAPAKAIADRLIDHFWNAREGERPWVDAMRAGRIERRDDADEVHVERVLGALAERCDLESIRACRHRVVLNSVNASGVRPGRMLLERLGCEVVHLHADDSGVFPHTPEPTAENLGWMRESIIGARAGVAFAQDPDGDRLAILDEAGRYIGEEYTLVLSALALLEARPRASDGAERFTLAANLSTSRMIDDIAARANARVIRTPVGEANLVEAMLASDAVMGGEGNGGVVWPRVGLIRDSLVAMGLTLALLSSRGRSLGECLSEIPSYAIVKRKRPVRDGLVDRAIEAVRSAFPGAPTNDSDGLRVDLELEDASEPNARGWVHVRASNTEPIIRLIAEAPTTALAEDILDRVQAAMPGSIGHGSGGWGWTAWRAGARLDQNDRWLWSESRS